MYKKIQKWDINMSKLARDSGYTLSHVSRVFKGTRDMSIQCAKSMSAALGISIDELVELLEAGIVTVITKGG